jgi:C-terminal processing protease CtpA/Prc
MSQSTAELTTAIFKKFKLAHVVGKTTRGWGSVENTFPIEADIDPTQKFTVLLVHSLTLREDNQPIEGKGVDPDVDISQPDWQSQLSKYFSSPSLVSALKSHATQPPIK